MRISPFDFLVYIYFQAKIVLYKNGAKVKEVEFDGQGSDMTSWLEQSRLLSSSWTDMTTTIGTNIFSIYG
jgi:hypothetical protein